VTRARLRALVPIALAWALVPAAAIALATAPTSALPQPADGRAALVIRVDAVSFEELLGISEVAALARAGGAGLLANAEDVVTVPGTPGSSEQTLEIYPARVGGADGVGRALREAVLGSPAQELLVIVVGGRSSRMGEARDELSGIVLAAGAPRELFPEDGGAGSLTSDSTRRVGVVTGGDVRATLNGYLGASPLLSGEIAPGEPIRVVKGPPPFELHERYLAQRRMAVPIGTAAALYAAVAGLLGVAFVAGRGRLPVALGRVAGWATLSIPMLAAGLLATGHLRELTYAATVPMVAIVAVLGTLAFSPLRARDATLVPAGIGLAVLAYLVLEAALGWSGMLTPLLGGTQLDGGRFFGLPNVAVGLLVGSGLWVAQRLPTSSGFALLCGIGLFAGLPLLGSNLGGAVTGFAAAGLWLAVHERDRLGAWRGLAALLVTTALGTAAVLLAHAVSPVVTHVQRFEESAGGLAGALERYADRLKVGFDLIARSPAALIPVVGLPLALAVALRPPGPIRETFESHPAWRDAVVVTLGAGIVAYLANDSGPAAAGLAFGMGLGGMLGVSLLSPAVKMGEP
jgi:hypothetical protein